MTTCE